MKKLLFVIANFKVGGIQKSLINLLNVVSDGYDIDVAAFDCTGEYLASIPEKVHLVKLPRHYAMFARPLNSLKSSGLLFVRKGLFGLIAKVFNKGAAFQTVSPLFSLREKYDAAISFSHSGHYKSVNGICPEFVLHRIKADKRICFIHCDYQDSGFACEYNERLYAKFDSVACCSESVQRRLAGAVPTIADKTTYVRNCYDLEIGNCVAEDMGLSADTINVFSVARLSEEKGIARAVTALAESGRKDIRYYIVGDGSQRGNIERLITELNLQNQVFLLGEVTNPYPKLRNADYLLVPSYHEAAPMVFDEAKVLHIPIVSTETVSAAEMLGTNDIICENSAEGILDAICSLKKPSLVTNEAIGVDNEMQKTQFQALIG